MDLTDVLYEKRDGVAWITINRPERRNAFRGRTVSELIGCFHDAGHDRAVGVALLPGAGDKTFCAGGGQKERAPTSGYERMGVTTPHTVIPHSPKPVIATGKRVATG